jgi:hypothetical protein
MAEYNRLRWNVIDSQETITLDEPDNSDVREWLIQLGISEDIRKDQLFDFTYQVYADYPTAWVMADYYPARHYLECSIYLIRPTPLQRLPLWQNTRNE